MQLPDACADSLAHDAGPHNPSSVRTETRIDAAHDMRTQSTLEAELAYASSRQPLPPPAAAPSRAEDEAASVPCDWHAAAEKLRRQASQLQEYLSLRQRELDHREARIHAAAADLENQLRAARLAIAEQSSVSAIEALSPRPATARPDSTHDSRARAESREAQADAERFLERVDAVQRQWLDCIRGWSDHLRRRGDDLRRDSRKLADRRLALETARVELLEHFGELVRLRTTLERLLDEARPTTSAARRAKAIKTTGGNLLAWGGDSRNLKFDELRDEIAARYESLLRYRRRMAPTASGGTSPAWPTHGQRYPG